MPGIAGAELKAYNQLLMENDEVYRSAITRLGLSEAAFWILYALRADGDGEDGLTQAQICEMYSLPRQTANSALKGLEAVGLVAQTAGSDRRRKHLRLTTAGVELARRTADRLIEAENATFAGLTPETQRALLTSLRSYTDLLRENLKELQK